AKSPVTHGTTRLGTMSPPRADTHFRIASNTKSMTAAVIVLLAQEGKLSLDDPVSKYVPSVPNGDNITIDELLRMRSGLYNYTDAPELAAIVDRDPTKVWTTEEVLAIAFARSPNFPPHIQAAARAGTLLPTDYTDLNPSFAYFPGGVISTASDLAIWIEALVAGRVFDAAYQRRWLDSLQAKDPRMPDGQQYGYGME